MKEGSQQWGDLGRSSGDYPGDSCGKGRRRWEDLKKSQLIFCSPAKVCPVTDKVEILLGKRGHYEIWLLSMSV